MWRLGSRSHGRMGSLVATCLFLGLLITALNIWQLSTLQNQVEQLSTLQNQVEQLSTLQNQV